MERRFLVVMEDSAGDTHTWNGEAADEGQAVDVAREDLDPEDSMTVIDVEEEY